MWLFSALMLCGSSSINSGFVDKIYISNILKEKNLKDLFLYFPFWKKSIIISTRSRIEKKNIVIIIKAKRTFWNQEKGRLSVTDLGSISM